MESQWNAVKYHTATCQNLLQLVLWIKCMKKVYLKRMLHLTISVEATLNISLKNNKPIILGNLRQGISWFETG